jgi:hypothetical protein
MPEAAPLTAPEGARGDEEMDLLMWWLNLVGRIANRSQDDREERLPDDDLTSSSFAGNAS